MQVWRFKQCLNNDYIVCHVEKGAIYSGSDICLGQR